MSGNIFKLTNGKSATQRIEKNNVVVTVHWLEQLTGLDLVNHMLGSTGKKETSGDLDLGVDVDKISKDLLVQKLLNQGIPAEDIRKTGDIVHLKTPITGNPSNGYVQTDFMFGHPEWLEFRFMGGGDSRFKGEHRAILLASIAKAQGLIWSNKDGLLDRSTRTLITNNPSEAAARLIGGTVADTATVENVLNTIKDRADYHQLIADFKEALDRSPEGPQLDNGLLR